MNQEWFELRDWRKRNFAKAVWIPLRASQKVIEELKYGELGHKEEFFGVGSLAVPSSFKKKASELDWNDVGISHSHGGYVDHGRYIPADVYEDFAEKWTGINLVLEQHMNSQENSIWHLHQDLMISLHLKREGDIWVCPDEGYIDVAKLTRDEDGSPKLLEIRAEFLKDYLCARDMDLLMTSYRSRRAIIENADHINWPEGRADEEAQTERWQGGVVAIHEGGMRYGEKMAIFHVARTDVDPEEDVPTFGLPDDKNIVSRTWEQGHTGRKLFSIFGEFWRTEWIAKGESSPRIRGDKPNPTAFFITDSSGTKESRGTLDREGRWLWFSPSVITALSNRRGGALSWYTYDTGAVACSPDDGVHFGINKLGFINVYATDIGRLPDWQQAIWAGHNIPPEGGVSSELQDSQVRADPAKTQAPEEFLKKGISTLNTLASKRFGFELLKEHESIPEILKQTHRFRAIDKAGLFALAKDLARLTADSINTVKIQSIAKPPKDVKWGSLTSLEKLLATKISAEKAREILSPLVGVYELRHGDAHLPGGKIGEALNLVKVDPTLPFVHQGSQMLRGVVSSIYKITEVLNSDFEE